MAPPPRPRRAASRRALTSTKQTGPKGRERHQIDLAGMGLDAPAQNAMALEPQPPGGQASPRWPRVSALDRSVLARSAILLLQARGHRLPCAGCPVRPAIISRAGFERHEGQRRVQRRIDSREIGLGARCGGPTPATSLRPWARSRVGISRRQFRQSRRAALLHAAWSFRAPPRRCACPRTSAMSFRLSRQALGRIRKRSGWRGAFSILPARRGARPIWLERKPANRNRSDGRPDKASPVSTAEAPGTAWTAMPSSIAARTSLKPGSETSGVPASLTRAMRAPCADAPAGGAAPLRRCDRYKA